MSSSSVLQFELGGSAFNSLKTLRRLIAIGSEDDVQSQAVLAVEQLGARLLAAPERIAEAVDVLAGHTSTNIENLKAAIGISFGGTSKLIRESTSLLQFFLLCAACKTTLLDEECSRLMFEMLQQSGTLARLPCSAIQIARVIAQFSGAAATLAPADMMHEVAVTLAESCPEYDVFTKMDIGALANLFNNIFDYMRDEAVESILLAGHSNCVWLASTLLWLCGEKACLQINDKHSRGSPSAKLCININSKENVPWNLEVFKADVDPIRFICKTSADDPDILSLIPLRLMKTFIDQYYWSNEQQETRQKAINATGTIAQTLIAVISDRGLLYAQCEGCVSRKHCNEKPLAKVAQTSWLKKQNELITSYGWAAHDGVGVDPRLYESIVANIDNWRGLSKPSDGEECIKQPCQVFIDSIFPDGIETDFILDPALIVAVDAAVTCTAFFENGHRCLRPLEEKSIDVADSVLLQILLGGLDVSQFRRLAFEKLLPGIESWHDGDLVIASNGYVAGMNLLWTERCRPVDALGIRVQAGHIKKDQVMYSVVRELPFNNIVGVGARVPAFDATGLHRPETGWQHPIKDEAYRFETSAATQGSRIEIKHYMVYDDQLTKFTRKRRAAWTQAINAISMAKFFDAASHMTKESSKELSQRVAHRFQSKDVAWCDPFATPRLEPGVRTLVLTSTDPKVRIFAAGLCFDPRDICCQILMRGHSPLTLCLEEAEDGMKDENESWVIVD